MLYQNSCTKQEKMFTANVNLILWLILSAEKITYRSISEPIMTVSVSRSAFRLLVTYIKCWKLRQTVGTETLPWIFNLE